MARSDSPSSAEVVREIGGAETLRLLTQLVATAPTNLEDPIHRRWEKPNYLRASEAIVRAARAAGLTTTVYDPMVAGDVEGDWHGAPRPNVIADLNVGAQDTVLILAHYDVVPVPAEQLARWKSPPHTLTLRKDGRLYGRGSNDDLGSGVVASLVAMRHLAEDEDLRRNVRLVVACDEETGGEGGIEAIKAHDLELPRNDPGRFLRAEVALIPDGSPEATGGSSGVAFLDGSFARPVPLAQVVAFGEELVGLHDVARTWKSIYLSPDWPNRNAPEKVITGRASVTKFDFQASSGRRAGVGLVAVHAETDAANQIGASVTLVVDGSAPEIDRFVGSLEPILPAPFSLGRNGPTALTVPPGAKTLQVLGVACHGGYPHWGHNPVPPTLELLRSSIARHLLDGATIGTATFTVDLRIIPEMEVDRALSTVMKRTRAWSKAHRIPAQLEAPPSRIRSGYAIAPDHPAVLKLERILADVYGVRGVWGEYGGTDASALRDLKTPSGKPLPALVFGSMDPQAHINDAEESVNPRHLAGVVRAIERFVREP